MRAVEHPKNAVGHPIEVPRYHQPNAITIIPYCSA